MGLVLGVWELCHQGRTVGVVLDVGEQLHQGRTCHQREMEKCISFIWLLHFTNVPLSRTLIPLARNHSRGAFTTTASADPCTIVVVAFCKSLEATAASAPPRARTIAHAPARDQGIRHMASRRTGSSSPSRPWRHIGQRGGDSQRGAHDDSDKAVMAFNLDVRRPVAIAPSRLPCS